MEYHIPVLLEESLQALNLKQDGVYLDVTYGGGGHSAEILNRIGEQSKLYAFDQDADAIEKMNSDNRLVLIDSNFRHLEAYVKYFDIGGFDGVLADLGVSSHQFDVPERGFTYRHTSPLDMRMNQEMTLTAANVLNEYGFQELKQMFSAYGEIRNAITLSNAIIDKRKLKAFETSEDLNAVLETLMKGRKPKYFGQVYQALRIEVNDELNALKDMLSAATKNLKIGGRLVVISYHSLEDRIVKQWIKQCVYKADDPLRGGDKRMLKSIGGKFIKASKEELKRNPRASSAIMRTVEKMPL